MSDIISDLGLDEENLRWYQFAACNSMETNLFYDLYETDIHIARQVDQICYHCPVSSTCLNEGIDNREFGVWGGIYLDLGRVDKTSNSHKEEEDWTKLEKIHDRRFV